MDLTNLSRKYDMSGKLFLQQPLRALWKTVFLKSKQNP